jgi:Gamma-glutamyltranspeptidase
MSSPGQKFVADDPESATHPTEVLERTSGEDSQHENDNDDDDRMPFLGAATDDPNERELHRKHPKTRWQIISQTKRNILVILLIAIFLVLLFVGAIAWRVIHRDTIEGRGNRKVLIHAKHGAVATELDTCSNIGVSILREGGSAVDAAIASGICIGSINMFSAGIGGSLTPSKGTC